MGYSLTHSLTHLTIYLLTHLTIYSLTHSPRLGGAVACAFDRYLNKFIQFFTLVRLLQRERLVYGSVPHQPYLTHSLTHLLTHLLTHSLTVYLLPKQLQSSASLVALVSKLTTGLVRGFGSLIGVTAGLLSSCMGTITSALHEGVSSIIIEIENHNQQALLVSESVRASVNNKARYLLTHLTLLTHSPNLTHSLT